MAIPPPSKASVTNPAANTRRMRRIIAEDPEWTLTIVPSLIDLCLQHIVDNFENNPILLQLKPHQQKKVLDRLSTDMPLKVIANLISDESYWRRRCNQRWPVGHVEMYGNSWKRMFFERHLQDLLKLFIPGTTDPSVILDMVPLCQDYVVRLQVDQFLPPVKLEQPLQELDQSDSASENELDELNMDHYQLGDLMAGLRRLEELDLVFAVKDCGMNFEWNLFLFTMRDCHSLASAIKACHTLKIFRLTRSKVDDDKARVLIRSLLDHPSLMELDLSHNNVGDRGVRAAAKLINHSQLRILNLANNKIRALGAQALAHALSYNTTLLSLNLRLNCIEDEGGQALGHALQTNSTLTSLNLAGNELSEPTASLFSQVLSVNTTLTCINLSCNHFGLDGGKQLLEGMSDNKTLMEFDLRMSEIGQENEYLIGVALNANREAARLRTLQPTCCHLTVNSITSDATS